MERKNLYAIQLDWVNMSVGINLEIYYFKTDAQWISLLELMHLTKGNNIIGPHGRSANKFPYIHG